MWTNVVLTVLNIFGIWRWLGRQAQVEEGGARRRRSERATRPARRCSRSRCCRARRCRAADAKLGHCIDAMAGCRSGRLDYVVVSQGGVAGVGETLRRLPWRDAQVEGEDVRDATARRAVRAASKSLPRDQWPAR